MEGDEGWEEWIIYKFLKEMVLGQAMLDPGRAVRGGICSLLLRHLSGTKHLPFQRSTSEAIVHQAGAATCSLSLERFIRHDIYNSKQDRKTHPG